MCVLTHVVIVCMGMCEYMHVFMCEDVHGYERVWSECVQKSVFACA